MECKKCKAQLEPGVTICPECGTDHAASQPKGIVLTPAKLVAVTAAVVVLTALVVALILNGMGYSFRTPQETEPVIPSEDLMEEPLATIPADGNPDDVTCKGTYTVSDEEVAGDRTNVVATVGERQLTNGELQIYYWLEVQSFLSEYGSYISMLGMDHTQPLDTQVCTFSETPMTWQQFFLESALIDWHNYAALGEEGKLNGYEMGQEDVDIIAALPESLATEAGLNGFNSAEEYLAFNVGMGASIADYQAYTTTRNEGFLYFRSEYDKMLPTDEEIEDYFAEHAQEYAAEGVVKEYVDVRHILILPEGATLETIRTETFPEEAWAAGEKQAQEILDEWLAGDATEESFAAVANEYSVDSGSNTNGGLYTGVAPGEMVEEFDAWCFDESRQSGDYDIVKTNLGYHIMYFSGKAPAYNVDVRHILVLPEGATLETIRTETFPEEAWAAGEKQAQEILDEWLAGDATEESFAAVANEYSVDPGSNTNGGLYTDVATGDMVEAFDAWCFDADRVPGDYDIVRTELGFHIMYFSASRPLWKSQVESDMLGNRGADLILKITEKYPMTVDYSAITLGYVDMNK